MVRSPGGAPVPSEVRLLRHTPALDGLRGLAWAGVFVTHSSLFPGLAFGQASMFVFFGLSGFLITSLLVDERAVRGRVSLRRFVARRAWRLVPALVLFLVVWLAVVAVLGAHPWITSVPGTGAGQPESFTTALEGVGGALAYLTNWLTITGSYSGYVPLGHLWSLAVEEQVYLLWAPLVVVLLRWRRRAVVAVAVALAGLSTLEVVHLELAAHGYGGNRMYMGTDTRAGAFLIGGALAVVSAHGGLRVLRRATPSAVAAVVALGLLVCGLVDLTTRQPSLTAYCLAWAAATVGGPLLVASVVERPGGRLARLLSTPVLTYLGRRSYALYLWHYVWLTWFRSLGRPGILYALALSLVSAELSWRLVESRAQRWKNRTVPPVVPSPVDPGDVLRPADAVPA